MSSRLLKSPDSHELVRILRGIPLERLMILIRHAESEKNIFNYHGHNSAIDYPLTVMGIAEAKNFARQLRDNLNKALVVSSNSLASLQTAQIIANTLRLQQPIPRAALRAIDMGVIANLPDSEVFRRFPEIHEKLRSFQRGEMHPSQLLIPGRESFDDFAQRITGELEFIASQTGPVLVVAHQSAINMILHLVRSAGRNPEVTSFIKYSVQNLGCALLRTDSHSPSIWSMIMPDETSS